MMKKNCMNEIAKKTMKAAAAILGVVMMMGETVSVSAETFSLRGNPNLTATDSGNMDLELVGGPMQVLTMNQYPRDARVIVDGIYVFCPYNSRSMAMNNQYGNVSGKIVLDPLNYESNELWVVRNVGYGYVTIAPLYAPDHYLSGGFLDEQLGLQKLSSSSVRVQWMPKQNSDGSYTFINKSSGLALDDAHGSTATGNKIVSYTAGSFAGAQHWWLGCVSELTRQLSPTGRTSIPEGIYSICMKNNTQRAINVQYASRISDQAALCIDPYNGEKNEQFKIVHRGNNLYSIHPLHDTSLCLNNKLANPVHGYQITLHTYEDGDACSLWEVYKNADGTYSFRNYKTKLMMDISGGHETVGTPAIAYPYNDTNAQKYVVTRISAVGSDIVARMGEMMSGSYGDNVYKLGTVYRGAYSSEQCKGFAKKVTMVLFGYNIGSTCDKPNNYKISYNKNNTIEVGSISGYGSNNSSTVKNLLMQARPGDFIQVRRRSTGGSHSMIVYSVNETSVTVYECNTDNKNGIMKNTYTWAQFASRNSGTSLYTAKNYYLH